MPHRGQETAIRVLRLWLARNIGTGAHDEVQMTVQRGLLAAIPAGESPANRDAMGRRRGNCIHRR
jgi:hypothetical protein